MADLIFVLSLSAALFGLFAWAVHGQREQARAAAYARIRELPEWEHFAEQISILGRAIGDQVTPVLQRLAAQVLPVANALVPYAKEIRRLERRERIRRVVRFWDAKEPG